MVKMIKDGVPKVVLYTPIGKCILYESGLVRLFCDDGEVLVATVASCLDNLQDWSLKRKMLVAS